MKNPGLFVFSFMFVMLLSFHSSAQDNKSERPSPPAEVSGMIDHAKVTITYSSPSVKGRDIWGGLVPYNQVWRTGANEATVFETSSDLIINGQKLPAGKYGLFTIPGEKEWTIIFNSVWDQWGAFRYDESKDVLRVTSSSERSTEFHERMVIEIKGNTISLSWENLDVMFDAKE